MRSQDGMFEFQVLVHGRPIQEYWHQGQLFVEGRHNSEYTLRVRNNSNRRAVAVMSVDGLSVMSGQTASRSDSGYVISAHSYVDVPGWRLDDRDVAHFYFGSLPEAYASRMGKPQNIGVIGAAFYYEKRYEPPVDYGMAKGFGTTRGVPQTLGAETTRGIGTGFGRRTGHQVQRVQFDREDHAAAELAIRYDDAEGLRARGIIVTTSHYQGDRVVNARPFPGDEGCEPPPGWRGG